MVSIVERVSEEAYPVQYWDGSDIKKTFETDSDADDLNIEVELEAFLDY